MDLSDEPSGRGTLWVTGAGSGVGRAVAVEAAEAGWDVVLSGRRRAALEETAAMVAEKGGRSRVVPLDVRDSAAVDVAVSGLDRLDGLVLAAGLNTPRRTWADSQSAEFDEVVETNLLGPARQIGAALPLLRQQRGMVVIVSSYSAWTYSPGAGVAYNASKSGLSTLARDVNAQEAASGVRACHLCPGTIDSDFLRLRPNEPSAADRALMLAPADVARAIMFVLDSPDHVRIDELVLSPLSQTGGF